MKNQFFKLLIDNKISGAAVGKKSTLNLTQTAGEANLYVYDIITSDSFWGGISAKDVIGALAALDASVTTLNVHINSPGGEIFESRAIMAALQSFSGKTVAHIDSLCASAATSIALACNEVVMSQGAFFMIHNASGAVWGDKNDMIDMAALLEKIEVSIVNDYTSKTGKPADEIAALMDAETWFSADEALTNGFIDRIAQSPTASTNAWNLAAYKNPPKALAELVATPTPTPTPAAETTGLSMSQANANRLKLLLIL